MRQDLLHRAHSGSADERSLAAWVDNLIIENARLADEARWIPVGERMPKVGEDVLIKLPDWVWIGHRTSDGWYSFGSWGTVAVTHWRALTAPPEVTP